MDVLGEIRQKLLSGKQPVELVKEGYAKSSVYSVAKKVRNVQSGIPELPVDDELTELRRKREIIKLEKEIAELEAAKDKLPDRVAKLEAEMRRLNQQLPDLVANCYASLYMVILCKHGWNEDEALKEAMTIRNDFLENFWVHIELSEQLLPESKMRQKVQPHLSNHPTCKDIGLRLFRLQ